MIFNFVRVTAVTSQARNRLNKHFQRRKISWQNALTAHLVDELFLRMGHPAILIDQSISEDIMNITISY
jgi:hypothetical protein